MVHKVMSMIFFILTGAVLLNAQAPEIEWQKSLGGTSEEAANTIKQTSDTGYIITGYSASIDGDITEAHGNSDVWVVKLNPVGNIEWQKTYGGSGADYGRDILQTNDDGFIVVGYTNSPDGDVSFIRGSSDAWVVKLDPEGNIEWQQTYGGSLFDRANSIAQTTDGGYIIACVTMSDNDDVTENFGEQDYWLVKLASTGEIEWQKSYGGSKNDAPSEIHETLDGGYIVAGHTYSNDGDITDIHGIGTPDYWLVKLNVAGEIEWQNTLGGDEADFANSIVEIENGYVVAGETDSFDGDVTGHHGVNYADEWIVKLDLAGDIVWEKCLGGTGADIALSILQSQDENFVISGFTSTDNNGDVTDHYGEGGFGDYWIVKLDTNAIIRWQKCYGGSYTEEAFSIIETIDTAYAIAGWSGSIDGDITDHHGEETWWDFWIVKLSTPCHQVIYYADSDEDEFGNPEVYIYSCIDTFGFVLNDLDCNDTIVAINPDTKDICNSIDDNCNGEIDENALFVLWYLDTDNDDFGNTEIDSLSCFTPEGYVSDSADCDDTNPDIYPGAIEILNGLDDDCDGSTDENLDIKNEIMDALKIYPNPTEDILHLEYSGKEEIKIEIINITGQILQTIKLINFSTEINVGFYAAGVYVLKIQTADGEARISFVKE